MRVLQQNGKKIKRGARVVYLTAGCSVKSGSDSRKVEKGKPKNIDLMLETLKRCIYCT